MIHNVKRDGMTGMRVDLSHVLSILENVTTRVRKLDGAFLPDYSYTQKRHDAAAVARELLPLADALELAGQLIRNEYWTSKGMDDMLDWE